MRVPAEEVGTILGLDLSTGSLSSIISPLLASQIYSLLGLPALSLVGAGVVASGSAAAFYALPIEDRQPAPVAGAVYVEKVATWERDEPERTPPSPVSPWYGRSCASRAGRYAPVARVARA